METGTQFGRTKETSTYSDPTYEAWKLNTMKSTKK